MTSLPFGNVVWRRFVSSRIAEWLEWTRSIHLPSHIHLWEKYVQNIDADHAATRVLSGADRDSEEISLMAQFLLPSDSFWEDLESLADTPERIKRMYKVALSATIHDVIYELNAYGQEFEEIGLVAQFLSSNSAWFEVLLNHFRGYQYSLLKQAEKL